MQKLKNKIYTLLKKSEKWTKTDMIYLTKGSFWITSGKILGAISAFVLALAYANLLSKESYATYKYILSIVSILAITGLPDLEIALTRAIARGYDGTIKEVIKTRLRWGLIPAFGLMAVSIYYFINGNNILGYGFLISTVFNYLGRGLTYAPYLQGKKLFKTSALYNLIFNITITSLVVAGLFISSNILFFLIVYFLSKFLVKLFLHIKTYKRYKLNNKIDPIAISYGKHLTLMRFLSTVAGELDKILMWQYLGPAQLAIYSFAIIPTKQFRSFIVTFTTLAFPKMAEADYDSIKKTLPKKVFLLIGILIIPIIIFILIIPIVFQLFFPEYMDSVKYAQIVPLTALLYPINLLIAALEAQAKKKNLYKIKIISPIIKILLMVWLIQAYGIMGAVMALLASTITDSILMIYYFYKK